MSRRRALITGVTGQDGSYLAEWLLEKGYEVYGVVRRSSTENFARIEHLRGDIELVQADLLDQLSLINVDPARRAARDLQPRRAVLRADLVGAAGADGRVRRRRRRPLLEAIRLVERPDPLLQASSSEMFGKVREDAADRGDAVPPAQPLRRRQGVRPLHHRQLPRELRPVRLLRHSLQSRVAAAREGVRHPQDHPRGGAHQARARASELRLGNLDAHRDWGFAGDYVRAMWLMLQQDSPTTTSSPPARRTRCASSSSSPSSRRWSSMAEVRAAGPGPDPPGRGRPPRRQCRQGARACSAGRRRRLPRSWCTSWSMPTWRPSRLRPRRPRRRWAEPTLRSCVAGGPGAVLCPSCPLPSPASAAAA